MNKTKQNNIYNLKYFLFHNAWVLVLVFPISEVYKTYFSKNKIIQTVFNIITWKFTKFNKSYYNLFIEIMLITFYYLFFFNNAVFVNYFD